MAKVFWSSSRGGDWADARNWLYFTPNYNDDAVIRGANFTVTLSTAQAVNTLTVSGAGVVLTETSTGSLTLAFNRTMTIQNGALFNVAGQNAGFEGRARIDHATISFAAGSALGSGYLDLNSGTVVTTGSVTLAGNFYSSSTTTGAPNRVLAANGSTLTLNGRTSIESETQFGDAQHKGIVVVTRFDITNLGSVEIAGGTLAFVDADEFSIDVLSSDFTIDAGARLDLAGNLFRVRYLESHGTITSTSGVGTLALYQERGLVSAGAITGAVMVTIPTPFQEDDEGWEVRLDGKLSLSKGGGVRVVDGRLDLYGTLDIAKTATISVGTTGTRFSSGDLNVHSTFSIAGTVGIESGASLSLFGTGTLSGAVIGFVGDQGDAVLAVADGAVATISGRVTDVWLAVDGGASLTLSHANDLSYVTIRGSSVTIAAAGALRSDDVVLDGATLIASVNDTLAGDLRLSGLNTVAAARGTTLGLTGTVMAFRSTDGLRLGTAEEANGTIVFDLTGVETPGGSLTVAAGTMRVGTAAEVQSGLSQFAEITVASGAKIDLRGRSVTLPSLYGAGLVTSTGTAATTLSLTEGTFAGTITGSKLALRIAYDPSEGASSYVALTGASTYGSGTTIDLGAVLAFGTGGSVRGAIVDNGVLILDRAAGSTFANAVSGTGSIAHFSGTTRITGTNTYFGGTAVYDGTLIVASAGALGTGGVIIGGGTLATSVGTLGNGLLSIGSGELRFTANTTLGGSLYAYVDAQISAAHGVSATIASAIFGFSSPFSLIFGSASADGTLTLAPSQVNAQGNPYSVTVGGGTLVLGNDLGAELVSGARSLVIAGAGTLDLHGHAVVVGNGLLAGGVVNSGAAATLTLSGGVSYGTIAGAIDVVLGNDFTFGGAGSFTALRVGGFRATFSAAASETVYVDGGNATLVLADGGSLTGRIVGFGAGDAIEFDTIDFSRNNKLTYGQQTHVLTVTDGIHSASVTLDGSYARSGFVLSNDGDGHTVLSYAPAAAPFAHAAPAAFGEDTAAAADAAAPAAPELLLVG